MRIILWFIYSKYKCIANISYHNTNYKYQFARKNQFSIFLFISHELTNVQWQWALSSEQNSLYEMQICCWMGKLKCQTKLKWLIFYRNIAFNPFQWI